MSTKIEWTDETWNPIRARNKQTGGLGHFCVHASDGCRNCYAERLQPRWGNNIRFARQDREKVDLFLDEKVLVKPLKWQRGRKIFPCDMTDFALEDHPDKWLDAIFAVAALSPRHTYQMLTKRAERLYRYMTEWPQGSARVHHVFSAVHAILNDAAGKKEWSSSDPEFAAAEEAVKVWPLPNVWLGVSAEDEKNFEERVYWLRQTPAVKRWVSAEPLLSEFNPEAALGRGDVDWIVAGGESGPKARPCTIGHIRTIVNSCAGAGVAVFVKQLGKVPVNREGVAHELTFDARKGGDLRDFPEDLQVREFPK